MAEPIIRTEYTEGKVQVIYEFDWPDFVVGEVPPSCYECPCGFMEHKCGRRVPLDGKGRPPECKLRTLEEYIRDHFREVTKKVGWISVEDELPEDSENGVLVVVSGKPCENITLVEAIQIAYYSKAEGWIIELFPKWETPEVTHWMPMPPAPEVDHAD